MSQKLPYFHNLLLLFKVPTYLGTYLVVNLYLGMYLLNLFYRTVSIDCATAQTKIVQQINEWDNEDCETKPGDTEPHGQKCLYKVKHLGRIHLLHLQTTGKLRTSHL